MARFVVRRLLQMIPLLVGITFLSFVVVDLAPGDFFSTLRLNPSISPDLIRQMEAEFGYGQPLLVRYGRWVWRVLHLDFGVSVAYRVAVLDLIASRALNTLILSVASMVFTWALAIPIGTAVALRRGSVTDRALSFLSFLGMSVPSFFLAFLLMYLALETGWFPVGGTTSVDYPLLDPMEKIADRAAHLVLPVIVLGTSGMASLMRLMRSNVLEIQNADYVRTARAKGLPEWRVVGKHILRNALNPFVTLAGYELGTLMLDAVRSLDLYLVMGSVLMSAVLLLVGNLLADVALTLIDPRIEFTTLDAR